MTDKEFWQAAYLVMLHQSGDPKVAETYADVSLKHYQDRWGISVDGDV